MTVDLKVTETIQTVSIDAPVSPNPDPLPIGRSEVRPSVDGSRGEGVNLKGAASPAQREVVRPETVLRLVDVSKRFGATPAIDRVSFEVKRGEIVGVIGRSGAGSRRSSAVSTGSKSRIAGASRCSARTSCRSASAICAGSACVWA
jgi:ABC-type glutathione transport system ATPase component